MSSCGNGLIALIDNFLTNRKCCVKLKEKSKYRAITMGAPQGTKLGPWLWLVYVNDISASCSIMKYADDVTLYAPFMKKTSNAENFQVSLDEVSQWAQDNNMLINAKKTQLIQFTLSEPKYVDHFRMNGQPITSVESAKLLGVTIDRRLTFGEHIDKVCSNMDSRLYGMRALKRLGLNRKGLITYYTANIRSALTYACPVWSSLISDNLMDKVVQVERKALKVIYPDLSYDAAICECGMTPIKLSMQDQCSKLIL